MKSHSGFYQLAFSFLLVAGLWLTSGCGGNQTGTTGNAGVLSGDVASQVYVPPGQHDEFYAFFSGGFSGQLSVHGLPSGRLLKIIPVFSVDGEKGYGFNEETKPLLNTSHGFVPWDDPTIRNFHRQMVKRTGAGFSSMETTRPVSPVLT